MQEATAQPTPLASIGLAMADIKLAHSVFALPFAVLAVFMARDPAEGWPALLGRLALVVFCMVFARIWAMLANRIADAHIDAANPRTAQRAVASNRLPRSRAVLIALLAALGFVIGCAGFWVFFDNPWPLYLAVPVLIWIAFYSLTKRFTWLCHVFLGGALAASPVCAALAVRPESLIDTTAVWWLSGMVLAWVAGFDIIYALQDTDFDREAGLHSMPSRLGVKRSIWISRFLHTTAFACLVMVGLSDDRLAWLFACASALVAALLIAEHAVLARRGKAGIDMAFFTINGVVSVLLGAAGVLDLVL